MEISTLMYYQLNIDEIIDKYCVNKERPSLNCNGKCYLMSQMSTTPSSGESSETFILTESFIPLYFQDTTIILDTTSIADFDIAHNWKPKQLETFDVSKDIDHPPQC